MRQIKFRGYGEFEKKWIYGYGLHQVIYGYEDGESRTIWLTTGIKTIVAVHEKSAGQYTGLRDCNRKEIYEGDIVETTRERNHVIGVVTYYKAAWYIKSKDNKHIRLIPRFSIAENKVIGNVYQNPELLEREK